MYKYKVYVYAICKNESKFAKRWYDSMSEADGIYVLDTGSTDNTAELLKSFGATVETRIINPWRFDTARNESLKLLPKDADICVCTDLDEVFMTGWRKKLETAWDNGAVRVRYRYTWSFNPDGSEGSVFWISKIHSPNVYKWVNPVHEVLAWNDSSPEPNTLTAEGIQLNHYPDQTKSRGQYLPLLELAVKEDSTNDRNMHYLGREYMYYGRWEECIKTLKRHLQLITATWEDERCASMRFIARAYQMLKQNNEAYRWYLRAIAEAPHLREPWLDFAQFAYEIQDWELICWLAESALKITERPRTYITDAASWGSRPYDLAALGYYYTGRYEKSLYYAEKALEFSPNDSRLKSNLNIIKEKIGKS